MGASSFFRSSFAGTATELLGRFSNGASTSSRCSSSFSKKRSVRNLFEGAASYEQKPRLRTCRRKTSLAILPTWPNGYVTRRRHVRPLQRPSPR